MKHFIFYAIATLTLCSGVAEAKVSDYSKMTDQDCKGLFEKRKEYGKQEFAARDAYCTDRLNRSERAQLEQKVSK